MGAEWADGVPNWGPLEAVLGPEPGPWMWMGRVRRGDRVIEQYKHKDTRSYLNLDQDAQAWKIAYYPHMPAGSPPDVDPLPVADAIAQATS
jgi:hypothetical protein